jgi:hypothetical protein
LFCRLSYTLKPTGVEKLSRSLKLLCPKEKAPAVRAQAGLVRIHLRLPPVAAGQQEAAVAVVILVAVEAPAEVAVAAPGKQEPKACFDLSMIVIALRHKVYAELRRKLLSFVCVTTQLICRPLR